MTRIKKETLRGNRAWVQERSIRPTAIGSGSKLKQIECSKVASLMMKIDLRFLAPTFLSKSFLDSFPVRSQHAIRSTLYKQPSNFAKRLELMTPAHICDAYVILLMRKPFISDRNCLSPLCLRRYLKAYIKEFDDEINFLMRQDQIQIICEVHP